MKNEEIITKNKNIRPVYRGRSSYIPFRNFQEILEYFSHKKVLEDTLITPFYINDKGTYELYDYELTILIKEEINPNKYFLEKTGKKNIEEIDYDVLEKLRHLYFEIKSGDIEEFITMLKNYFDYIKNDKLISNRIPKTLGEYSLDSLYFEIY